METFVKSGYDGIWIVDKDTDLVYCEEDGGYYYFQQPGKVPEQTSQRFTSMHPAQKAWTENRIEWGY